jgi:bacterioferritin
MEDIENIAIKSSTAELLEIKKHASLSINCGAVTWDYPLDLIQACNLLNQSLASELVCMLRYRHHQITAKGINFPQVSAEFKEHAENEESHALMIAERISQLGGIANFNPASIFTKSITEFGAAEDLLSMIKEDLIAERIAIEVYRKNIIWFGNEDPTVLRNLTGFLLSS